MKNTQRHAIRCRCILNQQKNQDNPKPFTFLTCSLIEDDVLIQSYVECQNCGILHKVTDICKSEIISKSDLSGVVQTIDELKASIPDKILNVMKPYQNELDISCFQQVNLILEHSLWGERVLLKSDFIDNNKMVKYMRILAPTLVKVETINGQTYV